MGSISSSLSFLSTPSLSSSSSSSLFSPPSSSSSSSSSSSPPSRPILPYRNLNYFDLILIRSSVPLSGISVDFRISSFISHVVNKGHFVPPIVTFPYWDRIGLIQLPEFVNREEFDERNIEVLVANHYGVKSYTMREILERAEDVAIRQIVLEGEGQNDSQEGEKGKDDGDEKEKDSKEENVSSQSQIKSKLKTMSKKGSSMSLPTDPNSPSLLRAQFTSSLYSFIGRVTNRSLVDILSLPSPSPSSFEYKFQQLIRLSYHWISSSSEDFELILHNFMKPFGTDLADGSGDAKIDLSDIGIIFHQISRQFGNKYNGILNAFTESDIHKIIYENQNQNQNNASTQGKLQEGKDKTSLADSPSADDDSSTSSSSPSSTFILRSSFISHWHRSIVSALSLHQYSFDSILSGGFITILLRQTKMLSDHVDMEEEKEDIDGEKRMFYYLPSDFSHSGNIRCDDEMEVEGEKDKNKNKNKNPMVTATVQNSWRDGEAIKYFSGSFVGDECDLESGNGDGEGDDGSSGGKNFGR